MSLLLKNRLVSSANNIKDSIWEEFVIYHLHRLKRGPKTEPCGTPHFTVILFEMDVLYFTTLLNHSSTTQWQLLLYQSVQVCVRGYYDWLCQMLLRDLKPHP